MSFRPKRGDYVTLVKDVPTKIFHSFWAQGSQHTDVAIKAHQTFKVREKPRQAQDWEGLHGEVVDIQIGKGIDSVVPLSDIRKVEGESE